MILKKYERNHKNKFIPEMHLKQPGFTYNACGPFIKNKEQIQKFKETRESRYTNQAKLAFNMMWLMESLKLYQRGLASIVYKLFNKKLQMMLLKVKLSKTNNQLEELHKPIIRKLRKRKAHSSFIDNIWGARYAVDKQI